MTDSLTLQTGSGFYSPVFLLIALLITLIIGWLFWRMGRSDYNTGKESTAPFVSGNEVLEGQQVRIRSSDLYWGYTDALSAYYNLVKPFHTGNAADYILAYLSVTALVIIMVVIFR